MRLQGTVEQAGVGEAGMAHTHARPRISAQGMDMGMEHGSMAAWGIAEHGHARAPGQSTRVPGQDHFGLQGNTKRHAEHVALRSHAGKGRFALLRNSQTYEILVTEGVTRRASAIAVMPSTL